MSKKEELAMKFMIAFAKCHCDAAMAILEHPEFDIDNKASLLNIPDSVARENINAHKISQADLHIAFATACPAAIKKFNLLAQRAKALKIAQEGLDEYASVLDELSRE